MAERAGVVITATEIKIYGRLLYSIDRAPHRAGEPNVACLVSLRRLKDNKVISDTTTDKYGNYYFILDPSLPQVYGNYRIEFRGSGAVEYLDDIVQNGIRGDWLEIEVPSDTSYIPVFASIQGVNLTVNETTIDDGDEITSVANINITNVDLSAGRINVIVIDRKLSSDSEYERVGSFDVRWQGNDNSGKFLIAGMAWNHTGVDHDFQIMFMDSEGNFAIDGNGDIAVLVAENITFDGVPDLADYPAVTGIIVPNATDTQVGDYSDPNLIPPGGIARIEWNDMKLAGDVEDHPLVNGGTSNISAHQWKIIKSYIVLIYITETGHPQESYPTSSETNGDWYFLTETPYTYAEVSVPQGKRIGFYVCCRTKLAGESSIADIPTLSYEQI